MMNNTNDVLKGIREQMPVVDAQLTEARRLLGLLEQAGEDATALRTQLVELEARRRKWQMMLDRNQ